MRTYNDIFTNDDRNKVSHSLKHLRKLIHLNMYALYNVKQNKKDMNTVLPSYSNSIHQIGLQYVYLSLYFNWFGVISINIDKCSATQVHLGCWPLELAIRTKGRTRQPIKCVRRSAGTARRNLSL